MIFNWLGLTGETLLMSQIFATILSAFALIMMVVFYFMYSTNVNENRRLARSYMRVSAMFGITMGVSGLFGTGTMWYLDIFIIAMNSFTYYINRD